MTDPTFSSVNFRPAGTENPKQTNLNIYIPPNAASPAPCLIAPRLGFFIVSDVAPTLEDLDELPRAAYDAGIAVVDSTLTISDQGGSYAGGGMYWRPEDAGWDIEGGAADIPQLDVIWMIQHIRKNLVTYGLSGDYFLASTSAGSDCVAFPAVSEDFAEPGSSILQCRESTRDGCKGLLTAITQAHFSAFPTTKPPSVLDLVHIRKASDTSLPAIQAVDAVAGHISSASWGVRLVDSAVRDINAVLPMYMRAGQKAPGTGALGTLSYGINSTTLLPTFAGSPTQGLIDPHDAWQYVILRQQLSGLSSYHDVASRLVSPVNWTVNGVSPDAIIASLSEWAADAVSWMTDILESAETAGTLNLRMDWGSVEQLACTGVQTPRSGGMVQRRQTSTVVSRHYDQRGVRRWTLNWRSASRGEHDFVLNLWKAAHGAVRPITFFPPDGGSIIGRFVGGSFRAQQVDAKRFAMSCVIEEMP